MKRTEMVQIITLLAGNYDSIANKSPKQQELMLNTWYECLGDLDYQIVLHAVKKSIIDSSYPPTIHEIRKNATEITNPTTKRTAIEAWNEALNMISGGLYMTKEQFDFCSPEVKKFFGSVNQVRQLAMLDSETINSVTKGQFLKQYDVLVEREREEKMLPEPMKEMFGALADRMDVNKLLGSTAE